MTREELSEIEQAMQSTPLSIRPDEARPDHREIHEAPPRLLRMAVVWAVWLVAGWLIGHLAESPAGAGALVAFAAFPFVLGASLRRRGGGAEWPALEEDGRSSRQ